MNSTSTELGPVVSSWSGDERLRFHKRQGTSDQLSGYQFLMNNSATWSKLILLNSHPIVPGWNWNPKRKKLHEHAPHGSSSTVSEVSIMITWYQDHVPATSDDAFYFHVFTRKTVVNRLRAGWSGFETQQGVTTYRPTPGPIRRPRWSSG
jgi:hypothetical protein